MYSDKVANTNVTLKQCHKVKSKSLNKDLENFLCGSGFTPRNNFKTKGTEYVFVLNDFAELRQAISIDKLSSDQTCKLRISKIYKPSGNGSDFTEAKILEKLFED